MTLQILFSMASFLGMLESLSVAGAMSAGTSHVIRLCWSFMSAGFFAATISPIFTPSLCPLSVGLVAAGLVGLLLFSRRRSRI